MGISTVENVVLRDDAGVDEDAGDNGVQESQILTDERTDGPYDFTDLKRQGDGVHQRSVDDDGEGESATSPS